MVKIMMITVMTITSDDDDHYHHHRHRHNLNHDDDQALLTNHLSHTICFSLLTHLNFHFLTFFISGYGYVILYLCVYIVLENFIFMK